MSRMIVKYPGSKWSIAEWIVSKMPEHRSYLEPYFGSGAVFFTKSPSKIETINDLDNDVTNLFTIIRDNAEELCKNLWATPYSRTEYTNACDRTDLSELPDMERARRFLIRCWQGHGYRTNERKIGWKNDIQGRDAAYAMRNWYRLPGWILDIVDRLKETQIENRPALDVIFRFNYPNVLIYADPPYVLRTRTGKQYKHEMNDNDHEELINALRGHLGPAIISGYECDLYNDSLVDWNKYSTQAFADSGAQRKEVLWTNFDINNSLFDIGDKQHG